MSAWYPKTRHYLFIAALIIITLAMFALIACTRTVTYHAEPIANFGTKDCFAIEERGHGETVDLGTYCKETRTGVMTVRWSK